MTPCILGDAVSWLVTLPISAYPSFLAVGASIPTYLGPSRVYPLQRFSGPSSTRIARNFCRPFSTYPSANRPDMKLCCVRTSEFRHSSASLEPTAAAATARRHAFHVFASHNPSPSQPSSKTVAGCGIQRISVFPGNQASPSSLSCAFGMLPNLTNVSVYDH